MSPVLAEVILIAITLVAAVAIAGFVFGLFGSFTSSAQVTVQVQTCTQVGPNAVCTLTITNKGTANTAATTPLATACGVQIGGNPTTGVFAYGQIGGTTQTAFVAGTVQLGATCTAAGTAPPAGFQAVGLIHLSNGATIQFASVWT